MNGASETRGRRAMRYAAALYGIGTIVHSADHFRRGAGVVTKHVFYTGSVLTLLAFATIGLVFARHRLAPLAAAIVGLYHGAGIAAAHLLPHWSVFSDAFIGSNRGPDITGLTWVAVFMEIAGAFATGIAGVVVLRSERARRGAAVAA